ncbi:alpha/beta hydrolase-fold protein [Flavobacterium sp.]|uniref:alpha/beta hydrolase-fold protein n=1 Tax=Flavobacterium sp. TaxID=239 RepID=UPI003750EB61
MKKTLLIFMLLIVNSITAQVTLRITAIPSNTPINATIYIAGSLNTWNPSNTEYTMQPDGFGAWQILIPEGTGVVEYKFTRGSWVSVEGNASGGYLPNRSFAFTGNPQTINLTIQSWEDIAGSGTTSTAASNVQILSNNFYMPQLNRYRKIWIYLPPDYFTTSKNYPVIYMQDGQNLFDNATSFSGEWQIDETLNTLHSQGNYGAIVVGIDNGGAERLNEYSPWVNSSYGGGQGNLYMQFVAETLKPYIDINFRTRPESQFNALIGSSMGAFISTYGSTAYSNYFSKVGIFSPAFWFSLTNMNNYITSTTNNLTNLRMYFVAGQTESSSMVTDVNLVKNIFLSKGVSNSNVITKFDSYGTHTESYWRGEFSAAYLWLFQTENLLESNQPQIEKPIVYQDNYGNIVAQGIADNLDLDVFSIQGLNIGTINVSNGSNHLPISISSGIYFLKSKSNPTAEVIKIFLR